MVAGGEVGASCGRMPRAWRSLPNNPSKELSECRLLLINIHPPICPLLHPYDHEPLPAVRGTRLICGIHGDSLHTQCWPAESPLRRDNASVRPFDHKPHSSPSLSRCDLQETRLGFCAQSLIRTNGQAASRTYATAEKDKVAEFKGQKGSDVRICCQPHTSG